jgi:Uma2 family endonuclease
MEATQLLTAEDLFWMPGDEPWELWDGRLRQAPGSGPEASVIGGGVLVQISSSVRPRRLGLVTGAKGGYICARNPDTVLVPDIGFNRWERLTGGMVPKEFCPVPPDLAVEVLTFWNRPGDIEAKAWHGRKADVLIVWWINQDRRTVSIYRHGEFAAELAESDVLDAEDILPGFTLLVSEIFS